MSKDRLKAMMRPRVALLRLLLLTHLLLAGCGGASVGAPKIDATNDETLRSSLDRITSGMSDTERRQFEAACTALRLPQDTRRSFQAGLSKSAGLSQADSYKPLHGLTAAEVIKKAGDLSSQKPAGSSGSSKKTKGLFAP